MICRAENRLEDFEFHDARLTLNRLDGGELTLNAEHMNLRKTAGYGALAYDMELDSAKIMFQGFCGAAFEPGRAWKTGADGRLHADGPLIVFRDAEAERLILEELRGGIDVYALGRSEGGRYYIEGCGTEPFFTMEFMSSGIVVEWDGFCKRAWYELHRQSWRKVILNTPDGRQQVSVHIICHDENACCQGDLEQAPLVTAGIKYGNKDLWGKGKDEESAFDALQEQLPRGAVIMPAN